MAWCSVHCSSSAQLLPSQAPDRRVTPRCPFDAPRYYKNGACASRASHRVAGRRPPRPSASLLRQAEVLHHLGSLAGGGAFVARLGRERRLQQRLDCDGRKEACGGNARRRSCASVFMVRWRRYESLACAFGWGAWERLDIQYPTPHPDRTTTALKHVPCGKDVEGQAVSVCRWWTPHRCAVQPGAPAVPQRGAHGRTRHTCPLREAFHAPAAAAWGAIALGAARKARAHPNRFGPGRPQLSPPARAPRRRPAPAQPPRDTRPVPLGAAWGVELRHCTCRAHGQGGQRRRLAAKAAAKVRAGRAGSGTSAGKCAPARTVRIERPQGGPRAQWRRANRRTALPKVRLPLPWLSLACAWQQQQQRWRASRPLPCARPPLARTQHTHR